VITPYKHLLSYSWIKKEPGLFWMAMFLWMGLPAIEYILTLVAMKWYPLDRDMMHEIQLNNQKLRPSKQKPIITTGPDTKVSG
jgi:glycoside/pentoside/hexuronide:cation symporter, GPH family